MNKKTIGGAIVFLGLISGGVFYSLASGPIDESALAKDGFTKCAMTSLVCPVYLNDSRRAFFKASVKSAKDIAADVKYLDVALPAMKCQGADGTGIIVLKSDAKFSSLEKVSDELGIVDASLCRIAECSGKVCDSIDSTETAEISTPTCAWRPAKSDAKLCTRLDGTDPGDENTMQPGQWKGAGCFIKPCFEIAGQSNGVTK